MKGQASRKPMRILVEPSEDENARLEQAHAIFVTQGCLVLKQVFAREYIASLAQAYARHRPQVPGLSRWNYGVSVGPGREITTLPLKAPFDQPDFYAQPLLCRLLARLLGPDFVLSSCSVVLAQPGASAQRRHRDINLLYDNTLVSLRMPTFALTIGIPLIDLTPETGTTALHPGSHLEIVTERILENPPLEPFLAQGDVYFFDSRLFHHGTANPGSAPRPIVYLTYTRAWFLDHENLLETLLVDESALQAAPAAYPLLLSRATLLKDESPPPS